VTKYGSSAKDRMNDGKTWFVEYDFTYNRKK